MCQCVCVSVQASLALAEGGGGECALCPPPPPPPPPPGSAPVSQITVSLLSLRAQPYSVIGTIQHDLFQWSFIWRVSFHFQMKCGAKYFGVCPPASFQVACFLKYTVPISRKNAKIHSCMIPLVCQQGFLQFNKSWCCPALASFFENGLVRPRLVSVAISSLLVSEFGLAH